MKFTLSMKKNNTFKYVLKKGIYLKCKYIIVYISQAKNYKSNSSNYLGICVSKKHGNSVQRNKMKRWAKEIYKSQETKLKHGYNIIVLYKKGIIFNQLNFCNVKEDLIKAFEDLKLYEK